MRHFWDVRVVPKMAAFLLAKQLIEKLIKLVLKKLPSFKLNLFLSDQSFGANMKVGVNGLIPSKDLQE